MSASETLQAVMEAVAEAWSTLFQKSTSIGEPNLEASFAASFAGEIEGA
ncbi:MAG: hypothetical protein HQL31_09720, partial [Planctomycetes bacterium]|nr:hypothetical protein [Planctomycetota bacterium]